MSPRVLVISEWFPYPPVNGSKIRVLNLVRQLAQFAQVDLVALVNTLTSDQVQEGTAYLQQFCNTVLAVPAIPYTPDKSNMLRKLLNPLPDSISQSQNPPLEDRIQTLCKANQYAAIVATEGGALPYTIAYTVNKLHLRPLILDGVEIGQFRPRQALPINKRFRLHLNWLKNKPFIQSLLRQVDFFTTPSTREYNNLRELAPSRLPGKVVPNVIDLSDYQQDHGKREKASLIYTGSFSYPANYQAVTWFASQVWPLIPARQSLKLRVTGSTANADLESLIRLCPEIEFTGFVRDVKSYIAQSTISIVPIQDAGGTRLKILEAMALGTPVISTRLGAEGLDVTHQLNILLADTPAEFARCIEQLMQNETLWQRISENGRKLVAERYNMSIMGEQYRQIFMHLGVPL